METENFKLSLCEHSKELCTEQELSYWNMLDILGIWKIWSYIISQFNKEI